MSSFSAGLTGVGLLAIVEVVHHRKLLVSDGEVGFVGSLNVIDPSYQAAVQ